MLHRSQDARDRRGLQECPGYIDFQGLLRSSGSPLWYAARDRRCATIGLFALQCLLARMLSSGELIVLTSKDRHGKISLGNLTMRISKWVKLLLVILLF